MTSTISRHRLVLALVGAVATLPLLTGCFGIGDAVSGTVEQAVESQLGQDVDLNSDGGLPADFPTEVALIDGTISGGFGTTIDGKKSWAVTVEAANGLSAATDALVAAGFTLDTNMAGAEGGVAQLSNASYSVNLLGSADGLVYTVTAK